VSAPAFFFLAAEPNTLTSPALDRSAFMVNIDPQEICPKRKNL
jgi:hypothetical protein